MPRAHLLAAVLSLACSAGPDNGSAARTAADSPTVAHSEPVGLIVKPGPDTGAWAGIYPVVFEGFCEGESCDSHITAVACRDVQLRLSPVDSAPKVLLVRKDDTVAARDDQHLLRPGIVVLKRDFARAEEYVDGAMVPARDTIMFSQGDTVFLLLYGELGNWRAAHRGRRLMVTEFWAGPAHETLGGVTSSSDSSNAVGRSHPERVLWWRVTKRDGQVGWWRYQRDTVELLDLWLKEKWGVNCHGVE